MSLQIDTTYSDRSASAPFRWKSLGHVKFILVTSTNTTPPTHHSHREREQDIYWILKDALGRGWMDLPAHYYVDRDGKVWGGRRPDVPHASLRGRNQFSTAVCLVGGRNPQGHAEANYTEAQMEALGELLVHLHELHPDATVCGVNDLSNNRAPAFSVPEFWEYINTPKETPDVH